MKTISADEFKQRYGDQFTPDQHKLNFVGRVKQAFHGGIDQTAEAFNQLKSETNPIRGVEQALKAESGIASAITSPIAPIFEPVNKAINWAGDKIGNNPTVQKFANSKAGEVTSRVAEDATNLGNVAGTIALADLAPTGIKKVGEKIPSAVNAVTDKIPSLPKSEAVTNFARDIIPNKEGIINHQVTQALDLTPGDLNNIAQSTGNEVGRWVADKNAIGANKAETVINVKKIFDDNYKNVRTEIGKVKEVYKPSQVPRYVEALKAIKRQVQDVPGLQKTAVEVDRLFGKKENISLNDVQRVKELVDEHFNLYKQTGDVGEGAAKEGLANVRRDIKTFIENRVEKNTGVKIQGMNNDVQTSKGILDLVEKRSPRGLTRANIRPSDYGAFIAGTMVGGPLVGVAALFFKKLSQSPSVKLRFAKWLDTVSDAEKAQMQATLKQGGLPPELNQFIKNKGEPSSLKGKGYFGPGGMNSPLKEFGGYNDVSTNILDKLKGKTITSKQEISDLTNSGEIRQAERDIIRQTLADMPDKIYVKEFADKVKTELLPLEASHLKDGKYENIALPDELRGNVADYTERIYSSPIKTSAGDVHFAGDYPNANYFAHTRVEDLADKVAHKDMGYGLKVKQPLESGSTRRVIELQSDLFQKGRLNENVSKPLLEGKTPEETLALYKKEGVFPGTTLQDLQNEAKLTPYRNTWHERIIREEVKQAAIDGKTKLQFPTGETAMKIEGLGEESSWADAENPSGPLGQVKVGQAIVRAESDIGPAEDAEQWIVTDVLDDGKFKAVTKEVWDNSGKGKNGIQQDPTSSRTHPLDSFKETFDISGKVDTNNPIYRFYEKEVGKFLINKFGASKIKDPQGVEWYQIDIKPKMKDEPVKAFGMTKSNFS